MSGPLTGVRIIDLTTIVLGPVATQLLGDWGAEVIKVEPPEGEAMRGLGPARHKGMAAYFLNVNRNKKSLALDLKQPAAKEALLRLAKTADVFVHNMRPSAVERLGLHYAAVRAANPRITPNSAAASCGVSDDVGSSMISTRTSRVSALAISTSCWSAVDSRPARASVRICVAPTSSSNARARARIALRSMKPPRPAQ